MLRDIAFVSDGIETMRLSGSAGREKCSAEGTIPPMPAERARSLWCQVEVEPVFFASPAREPYFYTSSHMWAPTRKLFCKVPPSSVED